jgi:hypothetical protein
MSTPSSAFRSSNRSSMGSNVYTSQQQGGGNKKAGFAYQVGRDSWSNIYINGSAPVLSKGGCCSLKSLQFTSNPKVSQSRSIGSTTNTNRYFHIPGTR